MPKPSKLWPDSAVDTFYLERHLRTDGYKIIAGLDEVGRGPLAGPVVAACVVLPVDCDYRQFIDSKKLSAAELLRLFRELEINGAEISCARVSETEIDRINILAASLLAMQKAVAAMPDEPDFLLVDGKFPVPVSIPQQTLVRGESKSATIAAASIVAKVVRDRIMADYHQQFPAYNFRRNKGYPTVEHRLAIKKHGPCLIHRRTFKGVREYVGMSEK